MQWYLASLLMLLVLVGIGALTGGLLTVWLPARTRPAARMFLSVPLGWSILTLVAALLGWAGPGYAHCHCALLTAALAAAGAWTDRHGWRRRAGGGCLRLAAFCVLASFPVLGSLFQHGSFSLYNDTFLYDGQAQWLQEHGFWTLARTEGGHPLWSTVRLMQETPLRMGAPFLLGWVQAAFGLELPHLAFPVVAALGVVCGALGVGATVLAACPGRWPEAWLAALAAAVTLNGFAFGAVGGFLPQTWGLALASAAFGLRGLELGVPVDPRAGRARWRTGVPLGVCVAASMHCYWDVLPLEAPALAGTYLLPWPGRDLRAWRGVWEQARTPLLTALLLVNLEWGRAVRGILCNFHLVVGNPVAWSPWSFLAHALGLKTTIWERDRWLTRDLPLTLVPGGCVVAALWLGLLAASRPSWRRHFRPWTVRRPARWRWPALVPALVWLAMSAPLFAYFRWVVPSPWHGQAHNGWPDGLGQSWSQYKLAEWGSFVLISLVATLGTAAAMHHRSPRWRGALIVLLTFWCGLGLGWNWRIVRWRGEQLLLDMGVSRDPFAACLALRQRAAALPADDWIYLDWPADQPSRHFRELMVSFLYDHPLAADWSDDPALGDYVTPADARRAPGDYSWVLRYRLPTAARTEGPLAIGGMTLERNHPSAAPDPQTP